MSELAMNLTLMPAAKTFIWAFVFVVALPVLVTGGAVHLANKAMMINVTSVVAALSVVLFVGLAYTMMRNEISLDAQTLTVKAGFYERIVSRADIVWAESRVIDGSQEPDLWPRVRVNGVGLPGYQAGWFRLASGARVFLLVTHRPLVYLRIQGGEDFLLTVAKSSSLFELVQAGNGST